MRLVPRFEAARTTLLGAVAILAAACFALALFLPVYTDEIVWRAAQGRVAEDGGALSVTFQPGCGQYAIAVPALLYPFRLIDGALYHLLDTPFATRAWGVTLAIAWIALASILARRALPRGTGFAVVLGFATLGVMPFLLVISRPEQVLLIGFTCFFVPLFMPAPQLPPPLGAASLRAAGGVLLASFVLAAHPRGILALPLMLAFLWRIARRPAVAAVASAAVAIFAVVAYRNWAARWACPDDPGYAHLLMWDNLGSALEQHMFLPFMRELFHSLVYGGAWYLSEFLPKPTYTSGLLPGFDRPILAGTIAIAFVVFVTGGIAAFIEALIARAWRREPLAFFGTAALWLYYGAAVAIRVAKNDYEAAAMEPAMAMAALGSFQLGWRRLAELFGAARMAAVARGGLVVLLALSLASEAMLLANYIPDAAGAWREPGIPRGQQVSVSVAGYGALSRRIAAAARLCGIDAAAPGEHLVVDETTSFVFRRSRQPFFVTFFEEGWGKFRPDPTELWRDKKSAGMIVACERVPPALSGKAVSSGGFCCLPSFAPS